MDDPALYYRENVIGGVTLLDALRAGGVHRIVFSSTAAVYGGPDKVPIRENAPTRPVNPYGASKLAFEGAMGWYAAYGLRSVALRYFNVAGASARLGERHDPETHLIPNILAAAAGGPPVTLYGDDYPTADGTAIRDYIHVLDLADAHLAAHRADRADGARDRGLQPGVGDGLLRAPGPRGCAGRGRPADPPPVRPAARRRPARARRGEPARGRRPGVATAARLTRGDDRLGLAPRRPSVTDERA